MFKNELRNTIKLVATDIDGTLLNDAREMGDFTREVIEKLIAKGICFVPSTSRPYKELPPVLLDTSIRYYVCLNGAVIWDKVNDQVLKSHILSGNTAREIIKLTKPFEKATTVVVNGTIFSDKKILPLFEKIGGSQLVNRTMETRTLLDSVDELIEGLDSVDKLHFNFADADSTKACRQVVPNFPDIFVTASTAYNIEITNVLATKGKMVGELAKLIKLEPSLIMAFGDNDNDISLFKNSGYKVAMANGIESLKAIADEVTPYTNNDDGEARFLNDFFALGL